jgi:hypothetical protein
MDSSIEVNTVRSRRVRAQATVVAITLHVLAASVRAQSELPFSAGERLHYRVSAGKLGSIGEGVMSVEGPVDIRGTGAWVLRSEVHARVGFMKTSERAESWIDPSRMATLRYVKRARGPFSGADERVELFPSDQRWEDQRGRVGESPTTQPLDELSFIYFLRTMTLDADTIDSVVRHYDRDRNPVVVRVLGRDTLRTKAGTFATVKVEMRVKDPQRYGGEGVIRIHLSDDASRYPVRIESTVPMLGRMVLTLDSITTPSHSIAGQQHHPTRMSGEPSRARSSTYPSNFPSPPD